MKKIFAAASLAWLAGCASTPLEQDTAHIRLAKVVDVHTFNDVERKEARKAEPRPRSSVGMGIGFGVGTFGSFGGVMLGTGTGLGDRGRDLPPQVGQGANRFTVQPLASAERLEVMSYGKYQVGDCVKLFSGHPSEYARLFDLKPGEHCE